MTSFRKSFLEWKRFFQYIETMNKKNSYLGKLFYSFQNALHSNRIALILAEINHSRI